MGENNHVQAEPVQELSEILQVRRDKLAALREEGRDPFRQTRFERSAYSREILEDYSSYEGKTVSVAGQVVSVPCAFPAEEGDYVRGPNRNHR